ncbi:MAG: tetratricopeptide repeat protein, partial [Cyclobacteriaceae bacterium]
MRLWLVAVWVFFFLDGQGQVLMLKSPRQLMEKGKWKQALDLLQRNLRRDSLDVVSQYGVASWYASSRNPGSQIDSAHTWIRKSLLTYSRKSARERERLKRDQLDSSRLFGLKLTVDSLAFQRAKAQHSVDAYQYFTVAFFDALQVLQTIELRNELAYADALRLHTEDGYLGYLMRYPGSAREADARARLHRLQFEQAARIGTWEAFGDFTTKYPDNPYRGAAEKKIFEIVTAGGNPRDFNNFIKGYPASPWAKVARDFLFHLKPDSTDFPWSDSLRLEQRLSEGFLLPFVSSGKIGFVDEHGKVVVPATFEDLTDACRCEPVTQPILISPSSGVFSRQLKHLSSFKDNVQWFSTGHLFVSNDSTGALYHASGRLLLSDVEEIEPLESFLAFRKRNHWGLASLAGVELMPPAWEQLQVVGEFLLATRLGKRHIFPLSAIARVANRQPLPQPLVADDFRQFGDRYHVRNGALEGLVDASLKEVVPLDRQQISVYDQLVVVKKEKYSIRGFPPIDPARQYDQLVVKTPWMKTQEGILFHLYHMPRQQLCIHQADSVWFDQSLALSRKADSLHIFFPSGQSL